MFQLIMTVMGIALMSAMTLVSINYLPYWQTGARDAERQVRVALPLLEDAYDVATRAAAGTPPDVLPSGDGGFRANFVPVLKFAPASPSGFTWLYGIHADDGSRYANMNYFCLAPTQTISEGVGRGLYLGAGVFSKEQVFLNTACGASSSLPRPSDWAANPRALTFYVAYTAGVTR